MNIDQTQPLGLPSNLPKIPDVRLMHFIGRGGMGVVYRGFQTYLERDVAVKLLGERSKGTDFQARFQREAKILAGLSHPNIVSCYSAGTAPDGSCYLVMEFIDGPSLREHLDESGALDFDSAIRVCQEVADALRHGHLSNIIHRDVKPENILLQPKPEAAPDDPFPFHAKVVDLGLARSTSDDSVDMNITQPGQYMGSPSTMAPEQFEDADTVDHRADIYGLGCVLYHALAGEYAYSGRSLGVIISKKQAGKHTDLMEKRPATPEPIQALVRSMLETKPENRPQNYDDIIAACNEYLGVQTDGGKSRRPHWSWAALSVSAIALLAVFMWPDKTPGPTVPTFQIVGTEMGAEGDTAVFQVDVEQARLADYSYHWKVADSNGDPVAIPLATEPRLEFDLPEATEPYRYSVSVTVTDPTVDPETPAFVDTIELAVASDNDAPTLSFVAPKEVAGNSQVELRVQASDPDDGVTAYIWTVAGKPGAETREPKWTWIVPARTADDTITITATAVDASGQRSSSVSQTVRVQAENAPPSIEEITHTVNPVPEMETVGLVCLATDSDSTDALQYAWRQTAGPAVELTSAESWAATTSKRLEFRAPKTRFAKFPVPLEFVVTVTDNEGAASQKTHRLDLVAAVGTTFTSASDVLQLLLPEGDEDDTKLSPWKLSQGPDFNSWLPLTHSMFEVVDSDGRSKLIPDRGYSGFAKSSGWISTELPRGRWQLQGRMYPLDPNDNQKFAEKLETRIQVTNDEWVTISLTREGKLYRPKLSSPLLAKTTTADPISVGPFDPVQFEVIYTTDSVTLRVRSTQLAEPLEQAWSLSEITGCVCPRIQLVVHRGNGAFSELGCRGLAP